MMIKNIIGGAGAPAPDVRAERLREAANNLVKGDGVPLPNPMAHE